MIFQVVPELREWLETENYQLMITDIRWVRKLQAFLSHSLYMNMNVDHSAESL